MNEKDIERIFMNTRKSLVRSCCSDKREEKLELYKTPYGLRIFCSTCCAMSEDPDIMKVMQDFFMHRYIIAPQ